MICIMGKSGSGKSTLLRQMGLLDRPTSGEIVFDGVTVTKLSDGERTTMRLGDRICHYPKELSGGEQQRVAIARALVNDPKVIFADEPCANLDTLSSKMVMETLVSFNKNMGVTILFVSHDPDDKKYARSNITLSDGNMISENTT